MVVAGLRNASDVHDLGLQAISSRISLDSASTSYHSVSRGIATLSSVAAVRAIFASQRNEYVAGAYCFRGHVAKSGIELLTFRRAGVRQGREPRNFEVSGHSLACFFPICAPPNLHAVLASSHHPATIYLVTLYPRPAKRLQKRSSRICCLSQSLPPPLRRQQHISSPAMHCQQLKLRLCVHLHGNPRFACRRATPVCWQHHDISSSSRPNFSVAFEACISTFDF